MLRELYLWRDDQARLLDRPPFKVMGDETLMQISRLQPEHPFELPISPRQIDHRRGTPPGDRGERDRRAAAGPARAAAQRQWPARPAGSGAL